MSGNQREGHLFFYCKESWSGGGLLTELHTPQALPYTHKTYREHKRAIPSRFMKNCKSHKKRTNLFVYLFIFSLVVQCPNRLVKEKPRCIPGHNSLVNL